MKLWLTLTFLFVANTVFAADLPSYSGRVNDFTNTLTLSQLQDLEHKAANVKGAEIGVAVIPTLDGDDIEDFTNKLFKKWKVGQAGVNNGSLLLVAMQDHKLHIEVGYGLEGSIPDIVAKHIIENDIKPFLKKKDLYGAVNAYLDSVQGSIDNPAAAKTTATTASDTDWGKVMIWILIIGVIIFVLFIIIVGSGSGGGGGGGYYGGSDSSSSSSSSSFSFGGGDSGGGGASGSW